MKKIITSVVIAALLLCVAPLTVLAVEDNDVTKVTLDAVQNYNVGNECSTVIIQNSSRAEDFHNGITTKSLKDLQWSKKVGEAWQAMQSTDKIESDVQYKVVGTIEVKSTENYNFPTDVSKITIDKTASDIASVQNPSRTDAKNLKVEIILNSLATVTSKVYTAVGQHCEFSVDKEDAAQGETVTITVTSCDSGYEVTKDCVKVITSGDDVTVESTEDSQVFTFVMPNVPVSVRVNAVVEAATEEETTTADETTTAEETTAADETTAAETTAAETTAAEVTTAAAETTAAATQSPNTGDAGNAAMYLIILLSAIGIITTVIVKRRRNF